MRRVLLIAALCLAITGGSGAAAPVKLQGKGPAKPQNAAPPLKTTEFPDGTGTIGLPAGWRIDGAYRGAVGCKGPGGSAVVMGFPWVIQRPDHEVNNMAVRVEGPRARVGDLAGALREVLAHNKGRLVSLRSKPAPSGLPGIPAVYFLYEYQRDGQTLVGMGYFSTIGDPNDTVLPYWQLYSSAVIAPKERFMKDLPTMMAIWNSWRPNGQKPREGSNSALIDAVNEANRKRAQDTLKSQQEAFDRMNEKFMREVIKP
jgi:hypothetical protein